MTGWRSAFHDAPAERVPGATAARATTDGKCFGCGALTFGRRVVIGNGRTLTTEVRLCVVCTRDLREALR